MFYKITDDDGVDEAKILKTLHQNISTTKDGTKNVDMETKIVAYNVITTSDKIINGRMYPDPYVKITALEDRWVQKYAKPFLVNHDIYTEALGRICDAVYYKHDDETQIGGKEKIPDEVLDYFKSKKCFDEGTGSVIGKIMVTKDTVEKIKSGVYFTTSQSSATDGYVCNICGSNYFECSHCAGREYEKDGNQITCVPQTKDLFPIENSSVNSPANDSSILILFDLKTKKIILNTIDEELNKENEQESEEENGQDNCKFDKNKKIEDNSINNTEATKLKKEEEEETMTMTNDQVIAALARIKASDTATFEKSVGTFCKDSLDSLKAEFEKISDENLSHINVIVEKIIAHADEKIAEVKSKLNEAEDKLAEIEKSSKSDDVETPAIADSSEPVNGKITPVVVPDDTQVMVPVTETVQEPKPVNDVYSMFAIKKGGK